MELIDHYETLQEASNEAITFALQNVDGYGLEFLREWNEGNWCTIENEWPEFNIQSIAQQYLISQSGGMNY